MKFGTPVTVARGGGRTLGTPGCLRVIHGILVGARGHERYVRLTEDDPLDTIGWNKAGQIGHWSASVVKATRQRSTTMKFKITLKDPDGVYESILAAVNNSIEENEGLSADERETLLESRHEEISTKCKKWIKNGEYVSIMIDTENAIAIVLQA